MTNPRKMSLVFRVLFLDLRADKEDDEDDDDADNDDDDDDDDEKKEDKENGKVDDDDDDDDDEDDENDENDENDEVVGISRSKDQTTRHDRTCDHLATACLLQTVFRVGA
ncbi:hypothetical protein HZH66_003210 [Vespula vulgaris]|uniref:Uncharacterized protein n=1 Tax=Vespula vulgaris TaxID=7454 RepID=A0A834KL16_VESVU|nr:hypothetical protein HZH66_003210 [Vespula vulgaris]